MADADADDNTNEPVDGTAHSASARPQWDYQ